jgi:D-glycero-alpha-D-manno-heptose-7-phosphate kinase
MIVKSQAPTRLSIFGGGTDVYPYASDYGGATINMAINLRQYIQLTNKSDNWTIPQNATSNFYAKIFDEMNYHTLGGMSARFDAVIESGLGSSASAAVALVGAILKADGKKWSKDKIAERAWEIEVNKLSLYGGKQDQYAAVYGGCSLWHFNNKVHRQPLYRGLAERLSERILLFYSGSNRDNTKIQDGFKQLSDVQIKALNRMKSIAFTAYEEIYRGRWKNVGHLLDETWENKKKSNRVTTPRIDDLYHIAKDAGALGGKVCGSGGGGYMIFMVEGKHQDRVVSALNRAGADNVDYSIDWQGLDVRICEP